MAGFRDILGHKQEIAHLERAIESGKVSHAYIFTGEKGTGKHRLASAFAETLQCEDTQNRPCGNVIPAGRRKAATIRTSSMCLMKSRPVSASRISAAS